MLFHEWRTLGIGLNGEDAMIWRNEFGKGLVIEMHPHLETHMRVDFLHWLPISEYWHYFVENFVEGTLEVFGNNFISQNIVVDKKS